MARKIQLKNKSGEILHPETEVSAISDLVANPGGVGLSSLTSIRIGDTSYAIAANPDMTGYATTNYVDGRISVLMGGENVAQTFDTIKEIADYLDDHDEYINRLQNTEGLAGNAQNMALEEQHRINPLFVPKVFTISNIHFENWLSGYFPCDVQFTADMPQEYFEFKVIKQDTEAEMFKQGYEWDGKNFVRNGSSIVLDSTLISQSEADKFSFYLSKNGNSLQLNILYTEGNTTTSYSELGPQPIIPASSDLRDGNKIITTDNIASHLPSVPTRVGQLTNDEGYITSTALNGYALQANVPSATSDLNNDSGFITGANIAGLATETYVNNKVAEVVVPTKVSDLTNDAGYLTAHQSLSGYATEQYVDNKVDGIAVPSALSQLTNDMGFLTQHQSLADYATKNYVDTAVGNINVPTKVSDLTNDAGYLTQHQSLTGLATESFVNTAIGNISIPTKTSDLTNDSGFLTQHQSLSGLATESYVDNAIDEILGEGQIAANFDTIKEVADYLTQHGSDYADLVSAVNGKADVEDIPTKVSDLQNDAGYLTSHQSLNGYATETYVNSAVGAITVPTKTSDLTNDSGFLTSHQSLSGYATESYVNQAIVDAAVVVPWNTSELNNDAGFITAASLPTKADYIYIVDYAHPNFAEATAAFNAGKVVLLKGAAPDANGYAVLNYVSNSYITFSKFLTSRSRNYASFNTYYLTSENTWSTGSTVEGAREVVLNAVTGNPTLSGSEASLNSIKIGATSYKIPQPDLSTYAQKSEIPEKVSDLNNDTGFITSAALQPYALAVDVPTKVSDLQNDSGFLTSHQDISGKQDVLTAGTGIAINNNVISVSGIQGISYEVISEFPQAGQAGKIYLKSKSAKNKDVYEEYIWVNNDFELIGSTEIDLSGYAQTANLATVATSGDYDDLINKPTIPAGMTLLTKAINSYLSADELTAILAHPELYILELTGNVDTPNIYHYSYSNSSNLYYATIGGTVTMGTVNPNAPVTVYRVGKSDGYIQYQGQIKPKVYFGQNGISVNNTFNNIGIDSGYKLPTTSEWSGKLTAPTITSSDAGKVLKVNSNGDGWEVATVSGGGSSVSGINDGTNWTSLTVNGDTYAIPNSEGSPEAFNIGSLVGLYQQNDNTTPYNHSGYSMKIFAFDGNQKVDRHNIRVEVFDDNGDKVVLSTYVSFSSTTSNPVPSGTNWESIASFSIQDDLQNYDSNSFLVYKGTTMHTFTGNETYTVPTQEVYIIKHPVYGEFYWYSPLLIPDYTAGNGITISNGVISSSSSHIYTYEELAGHWPAEASSGIYVDVNSDGTYAVFFPAGTFGLPSDTTATGNITLSGSSLTLSNTQPAMLSSYLDGAEFALSIDSEGMFHMTHTQFGSYEKQLEPGIREKFGEPDTTTDGTYVLKATVSSGVVTYSWVLEA